MKRGLQFAHSALSQALFVLASLAFVLRAIVPVGFMIDRDPARDGLEITICSAYAAQQSVIDESIRLAIGSPGEPEGAERDGDSHPMESAQHCVFSIAFAATVSQPGFTVLSSFDWLQSAPWLPSSIEPTRSTTRAPLPPRGPPILL